MCGRGVYVGRGRQTVDDDVFYLFLQKQKKEPSSIYTLRKVRTIRGCLKLGWLSGLGLNFLLASVSFTHSHTLSLESCCRPTACKSSSPAGLSTLVYAYVVDCASASPYTYSSSTHRFPDERKHIEDTPLSATSADLGLGLGLGLGLDSLAHFSSHTVPFSSPPSFHTLFLFPTHVH